MLMSASTNFWQWNNWKWRWLPMFYCLSFCLKLYWQLPVLNSLARLKDSYINWHIHNHGTGSRSIWSHLPSWSDRYVNLCFVVLCLFHLCSSVLSELFVREVNNLNMKLCYTVFCFTCCTFLWIHRVTIICLGVVHL